MPLFRFDAAFRRELCADWSVLLLAVCCLLFGFSAPTFALPFLFSEVITEFGWTREQATLLASAKFLVGAVAALVAGRCLDVVGVRAALFGTLGITALIAALGWRLAFPALSIGIWLVIMPMLIFFMLIAFVVFRAAGHATVLIDTTVMNKHVFGMRNLGTMVGIFTAITSVGFALGPWMMGRLFDMNGSYDVAFVLFCIMPLAAVVMTWFLKPTFWKPLLSSLPIPQLEPDA